MSDIDHGRVGGAVNRTGLGNLADAMARMEALREPSKRGLVSPGEGKPANQRVRISWGQKSVRELQLLGTGPTTICNLVFVVKPGEESVQR